MVHPFRMVALAGAWLALAACNQEQRADVDSAAGTVGEAARSALTVIDVDMGRKVGADKKISEDADDDSFAKTDTIFASVHTSGLAREGEIAGRWIFPDSSVVDQQADGVTTEGDGYLVFFLTKPDGLTSGKYRFEVLVNGREVRDKEVTVK